MKGYKIIIGVLVLSFLLSLSGCISWTQKYDDITPGDVSSVDFYDLRNSEDYGSGFHKTASPVYTVPEEQLGDFLEALSEIKFTDGIVLLPVAWDPSFSYGQWVVRLNYTDGSYALLSDMGFGETFDAENDRLTSNHYSCDSDEWTALIFQFLPEDLV